MERKWVGSLDGPRNGACLVCDGIGIHYWDFWIHLDGVRGDSYCSCLADRQINLKTDRRWTDSLKYGDMD